MVFLGLQQPILHAWQKVFLVSAAELSLACVAATSILCLSVLGLELQTMTRNVRLRTPDKAGRLFDNNVGSGNGMSP
jgi:hypothetical protein